MSDDNDKPEIPDRTRRRFLKLAVYVPPTIISLSALRSAPARADVTGGVKVAAPTSVGVKIIGGLVFALLSCTAPDATRETLESAGYTDVAITGWSPMTCSDDDDFETGFRAKNPKGDWTTGTVCCGFLLKGCTIRH